MDFFSCSSRRFPLGVPAPVSQLLSYSYSSISTNFPGKLVWIVESALFRKRKCRIWWLCIANKSGTETLYMILEQNGGGLATEKGRFGAEDGWNSGKRGFEPHQSCEKAENIHFSEFWNPEKQKDETIGTLSVQPRISRLCRLSVFHWQKRCRPII